MKKVLIVILALCILFAFSAKAITADEIRSLISQIQRQIAELQQRMVNMTQDSTFQFDANLRHGDISEDVNHLHKALKEQGFTISASEENQTYFGDSTLNAVREFQEKYAEDVLSPWNLVQGTGFVGQTTRTQLNNVYMEGASGGEQTVLATCIETGDTGKQYDTIGQVTYNGVTYRDECSSDTVLKEYYCLNNTKQQEYYTCPHGCYNRACESAPEAAIAVTSPNGGEQWQKGGHYYIFWLAPSIAKVDIYLVGPSSSITIASDIDNTGSYAWTIPLTVQSGSEYKIKVKDSSSALFDESDDFFTISTAVITTSNCVELGDTGKQYDTIGQVTYNGVTYRDECSSDTVLKEYYCLNNTKQQEYYTCPHGCYNRACESAPEAAIAVTSPNGGEQWQKGGHYYIFWLAPSIAKVDIYLVGPSSSITIASDIDNTGSYTWIVPDTVTSGDKYKIKVKDASTTLFDESDDYFTISVCTDTDNGRNYEKKGAVVYNDLVYTDYCIDTSKLREYYCQNNIKHEDDEVCAAGCNNGACNAVVDAINLTSPTGGETWQLGQTYDITWTSTGITDANIWLSFPAGFTCKLMNMFAYVGKYSVTLSDDLCFNMFGAGSSILPGKYKIKIFGDSDSITDESGEFDICDGTVCTDTPATTTASINLTSPSGGETWQLGETYDITWTSTGITDANIWLSFPGGFTCKLMNLFASAGKYSLTLHNDLCQNMFGPGSISPGKYKIKIFGDTDDITDESGEFDIASATTFNSLHNQLANISSSISSIMERIKQLIND